MYASNAGYEAVVRITEDVRMLSNVAERVSRMKASGEKSAATGVVAILAERVADEIGSTQEWRLTATQQAALLQVLAAPAPSTAALQAATRRAEELFGT